MPMPSVDELLDVGIALSAEKNVDKLLEMILDEAMKIADCDGGTLYVVDGGALRFKIMITKSLGVRKGVDGEAIDLPPVAMSPNNVSGCAALDKTPVNIPDIYESSLFNFTGPKEFDARTGYKTVSMLTVPMEDENRDVVGVLQLVNARDESGSAVQGDAVIPFAPEYERVIYSLASQAAISLTRQQRAEEVSGLLDSFLRVMAAAIDARSPYNANHTRGMVRYAEKFAAWLDGSEVYGPGIFFDEHRKKQFLMSVWLHDIGKLAVPLEVMDKKTRLGARAGEVASRFQAIGLQNEINFLRGSIGRAEYGRRAEELRAARGLVAEADCSGFLTDETLAEIRKLGEMKADGPNGLNGLSGPDGHGHGHGLMPYLSEDELNCLLVQKGTLTAEERGIMESHVKITRRMLSEMRFPARYRSVPDWASSHHEYLNGSGYPAKLTSESIPMEVRILTILDVYDALTARDRPYKPAVSPERAFAVLGGMASAGQIDAEILEMFKQSEAWKD